MCRCPLYRGKPIIRCFMEAIRDAGVEEYVRGLLLCFGAPTIKGLKAASLINFQRDGEDIYSFWKSHGEELSGPLGVEGLLLNEGTNSRNALVMIYRLDILEQALKEETATAILTELGYPLPDLDACLEHLRGRYRVEFPHEIGLFLNYPPEDVRGFMEHREAKSLEAGYWKVYGNVNKARRTFRRYRRAERDAARFWMSGNGFVKKRGRDLANKSR